MSDKTAGAIVCAIAREGLAGPANLGRPRRVYALEGHVPEKSKGPEAQIVDSFELCPAGLRLRFGGRSMIVPYANWESLEEAVEEAPSDARAAKTVKR